MDATFDSLPFEIRIQICSYLSSDELQKLFAPVCKEWKKLACHPILRREITLDGDVQFLKNMNKTVRKSPKVRKIIFIHIWRWYVLSRSLPTCNYLREIEITNCNMHATCMKRLVSRFPAIENITLIFTPGQFDLLVAQLIAGWKLLKNITLDARSVLPTDGTDLIELYADKCEHLQKLDLENFSVLIRTVVKVVELRDCELVNLLIYDNCADNSPEQSNRVLKSLKRCWKSEHVFKDIFNWL